MRKDKIDIVSSELPGASFYIIEDYLRVHLQPYLKRFHTGLDIQSRKKIMNILQFLEALTYLSDICKKKEAALSDSLMKSKFEGLLIQKDELGYKILIDRDTVPANPTFINDWNALKSEVKIEALGEVMIKLYGIPNCDKIKKAKKMLEQSCVSYEFINLRESLPNESTIKHWLQVLDVNKLVNKRSTTYRKLNDDERNLSNIDEILTVISGHPTIIQRPLFEYKEAVKIGLSELSKAIEELN